MNISKSSWHYRLIRWLDRWPQNNFCPYVRQVCYAVATASFMGFAISAGTILALVILTYPVTQFWFPSGVLAIISFIVYGIIGGAAIKIYREEQYYKTFTWWAPWFHYDLLKPLKDALPERKEAVVKPPGIFRQWIRAAHDKTCPVIEFQREID